MSDLIETTKNSVAENLSGKGSEGSLTTLTGLPEGSSRPDKVDTPDLLCFSNDDCGNALRFTAVMGEDSRYCHALKSSYLWSGFRWEKDHTEQDRALAEEVANRFVKQARTALEKIAAIVAAAGGDPEIGKQKDRRSATKQPPQIRALIFQMFPVVDTVRFAEKCLNRGLITNMLREAGRRIALRPEEMDSDPLLLGSPSGTIDMRTGHLRAPRRNDFITKHIESPYDEEATCPQFLNFLFWAMDGERDPDRGRVMVDYLQMAFGYSFTGLSSEKSIFIPYGNEGDNGKTLLLNLLRRIAGDYGGMIRSSTLMAKRDTNAVTSDIADLRGVRFVMTSETEPGQKLSQAMLKFLTQGGEESETKARRLRENWITFREGHSIWLDCNALPDMPENVEDPALRRLIPIEFRVQISKEQMDRELGKKLFTERAGISAWLVKGAVKWIQSGQKLNHPPEIDLARDRWRRLDQFARFVDDRCVIGPGERIAARRVHQEFLNWWPTSGLTGEPMSETKFGTRMGKRFTDGRHTEAGWV
jgi:P4 family phage/plasmid primase-like protien